MSIHVTSEVQPLQKVLVHRPGLELEHLYPESLPKLLFDDIPYLSRAREEHDAFCDIMREEGVEVVYLEEIMAEVLASSPEVKNQFLTEFIKRSGDFPVRTTELLMESLMEIQDEKELVRKIIAGMQSDEVEGLQPTHLAKMMNLETQIFILDPMPNLYFTRDPFASIGTGVSIHHMYAPIRQRETIFAKYLFQYHPTFKDVPKYYSDEMPPSLEGGDILNLSENVLAVGLSQRTSPGAMEALAKNLFRSENSTIDTVLAVKIPSRRAYMHLDTVFTQLDVDKFVIHPGIRETAEVVALCKQDTGRSGDILFVEENGALDEILARYLGLDSVTFIPCGGSNRVAAEREQWNDGSNTLCIRPGVVIVYDRNQITNELLESHGIRTLAMPSSELSRGRGGPRCMSMPLLRSR